MGESEGDGMKLDIQRLSAHRLVTSDAEEIILCLLEPMSREALDASKAIHGRRSWSSDKHEGTERRKV